MIGATKYKTKNINKINNFFHTSSNFVCFASYFSWFFPEENFSEIYYIAKNKIVFLHPNMFNNLYIYKQTFKRQFIKTSHLESCFRNIGFRIMGINYSKISIFYKKI